MNSSLAVALEISGRTTMGEQQSQKRGVKSDAQKRAGSRYDYDPTPASGADAGAFGHHAPDRQSDKDAALSTKVNRGGRDQQTRSSERTE